MSLVIDGGMVPVNRLLCQNLDDYASINGRRDVECCRTCQYQSSRTSSQYWTSCQLTAVWFLRADFAARIWVGVSTSSDSD